MWLRHAKLTFFCYGMQSCGTMAGNQREIVYWLENKRVKNDDIELRKNLASLWVYGTHIERGIYITYWNILESTLVGRTFKLL